MAQSARPDRFATRNRQREHRKKIGAVTSYDVPNSTAYLIGPLEVGYYRINVFNVTNNAEVYVRQGGSSVVATANDCRLANKTGYAYVESQGGQQSAGSGAGAERAAWQIDFQVESNDDSDPWDGADNYVSVVSPGDTDGYTISVAVLDSTDATVP